MVGLEIAAGYLIAWAVRKARRAAGRLDEEADAAVDTALDHLHDVVARKLGREPALVALEREGAASAEGPLLSTQIEVRHALEGAVRQDPRFAADVAAAVERLRSLAPEAGDRHSLDLRGARGVQINNSAGNSQVNHFN
ncbi:hypothetical protein RVR_5561 [Actinacidiphila reveromycinica]|uniref:Chromosome partitioning protein n=1 Tax=Actinacidiphila reveromycinica TaxID=659352 RepID=A0A7U3VPT6_9ACTN|nr:hypothetical protein [Streptomyces sp. SN-593]BBA99087.1 hypothetical protein RVR_5561 [Streptomyces sp. SN-593]